MSTTKPTHVCVWPDGTMFRRETVTALAAHQRLPHNYATVRIKPGETMQDAAHRHQKAEARYWRSL